MSSDTQIDERLEGCVVHRAGDAEHGEQAAEADPVLTEVIRHGLNSAANQMKRALVRTAFSPIIYEVLDFAVAIYDDRIRLLAQAPSLPMFMGRLSFCVRAAVDAVGGPAALDPGDVLLYNHPYGTGSHPQDAALVMPVFDAGKLIGYAAVKGHWLDIGAKDPYATDTVDMHQEGTIYPGLRLYRRGELVDDIYRLALANSRLPHAVAGDIKAEVVAVRTGAAALSALVSRHGLDTFRACVERVFDHGEAVVRSYFERIPDGSYVGEGVLDNDGLSDDSIRFDVAILVEGSEVTVDFSDAPPQRPGPVNCTVPKTVAIARIAIGMLAGGGEAPNEGHYRAISVITRPGTMFHPIEPAPSFIGGWSAFQALETVYRAFSQSSPELVPACSGGDICSIVWWGRREATGEAWADGSPHPVGQGGHVGGDGGPALMHISESATRLTPTEVRETKSPILVSQVELIPDSGGAGHGRGGLGVRYTFNALEDMWITVVVERTKTPPWSLAGGKPGTCNSISLEAPEAPIRFLSKATRVAVPKGAVLELSTGGGGGFGEPAHRPVEAVHDDVRNGYLSEGRARADYPHAFEQVT
jgi:N-methylhydantoinase B